MNGNGLVRSGIGIKNGNTDISGDLAHPKYRIVRWGTSVTCLTAPQIQKGA